MILAAAITLMLMLYAIIEIRRLLAFHTCCRLLLAIYFLSFLRCHRLLDSFFLFLFLRFLTFSLPPLSTLSLMPMQMSFRYAYLFILYCRYADAS